MAHPIEADTMLRNTKMWTMFRRYGLTILLCVAIVLVYSYYQNNNSWYQIWDKMSKLKFTRMNSASADQEIAKRTESLSQPKSRDTLTFADQAMKSIQKTHETDHSNNITKYHGIDLMTLAPYNFSSAYKNPCWKVQGQLKCLPYFFIIGVKKCGTYKLWSLVLQHPDTVNSSYGKEPQWFARLRFRPKHADNFQMYINMFRTAAEVIENEYVEDPTTGERFHPLITGDASPSNLHFNSHWRYLPGNEQLDEPRFVILDYIHHFLPKAKIIITFRNPVERLYSDYYHEAVVHQWTDASPELFHEVVVNGLQLYKSCMKTRTLRSCVYDERIYTKIGINIQLGIYHIYWKELLRLFPRDQLLIVHIEEFRDEKSLQVKVYDFLELRPWFKSVGSKRTTIKNGRRSKYAIKGDMLNETRRLLEEFYKPHNEEMYRITLDPTFLYISKI